MGDDLPSDEASVVAEAPTVCSACRHEEPHTGGGLGVCLSDGCGCDGPAVVVFSRETLIPLGLHPHAGEPLSAVRSRLSGFHFAKESLSDGEQEILALAEALLAVLDAEAGGYRK